MPPRLERLSRFEGQQPEVGSQNSRVVLIPLATRSTPYVLRPGGCLENPSHRLAAGLLLVLAMAQASVSEADEIKVLCSTPLRHVMEELVPLFERATKHQVVVTYGPSPELRQKIDGGARFDLAVLTPR